jgi:hypothetical protein
VVLEESVEVISFGRSVQKRVLSGFGVEKAAHGIELTEIQSENSHNTDVSALQAQNKITGQSRQILFEGLPPQTQDLHGFFRRMEKHLWQWQSMAQST